jgi:uncharacterized protein (DUF58 family)
MQDNAIRLDATLLKAIQELSLTARQLVNGFLQGQHRSAQRGISQEFAAYRPYMPGDPLKDVDWKLWARNDHLFVRQFRHESNFRGYIFLDTTRSMDYGAGAAHKFTYARLLAACFASLMTAQLDAPALTLLGGEEGPRWFPPSTRQDHLDLLFHALAGAQPEGTATALGDLSALGEECRRRSLGIIISDAMMEPDRLRDLIEQLRLRDMDVLFMQVLAPEEMKPPFEGEIVLEDHETGQEIVLDSASLNEDYGPRLTRFLAETEQLCHGLEAHYCRLVTNEPLDEALHRYLDLREQL